MSWQPKKYEKIAVVIGNRLRGGSFEENGAMLEAVRV